MPDLADDDPLLTLEGTDYVYTLHAVWRAVEAKYIVEVWVHHGDGSYERLEIRFDGQDGDGYLSGVFGDTIDFNDPTNPFRSWTDDTGTHIELLNNNTQGWNFSITAPLGYEFAPNMMVPDDAQVRGEDKTIGTDRSVNSIVLDAKYDKTIYLFYEAIPDGVLYTVKRYIVLPDGTTTFEMDKNGNRLYRDADGNVLTGEGGTVVPEADLDNYLIRIKATAGQVARAVTTDVLDAMGISYPAGVSHVVFNHISYYIVRNDIAGFAFAVDLSALVSVDRVKGDSSTQLILYYDARKQDVIFNLGDGGEWTYSNQNYDDGWDGGTNGRVSTMEKINLPVKGDVTRDGYELVGWATSEQLAADAYASGDYSQLLAPGALWQVPPVPSEADGGEIDDDGCGIVRLWAVYKGLPSPFNIRVYRIEGGKVIRDKDFEKAASFTMNGGGTGTKRPYMNANEDSLLYAPTGSTVQLVLNPGDGSLTEGSNLLFIPDRAGYTPVTNPTFSTVYGQVKLSGEVTADGRMTLILYYEAWVGHSTYTIEYWYWDAVTGKPVKFSEDVAATVTLNSTAGYAANANTANPDASQIATQPGINVAPGALDNTVAGAPVDSNTNYTSLSWMWKNIEGYVAAPTGSWIYNGVDTPYTYTTWINYITYDASGNMVIDRREVSRTLQMLRGTNFASVLTGTVAGDPNNMLTLRLFYTQAPRQIIFDPQGGTWVSGTDTFSSSDSNIYTTDQVINVPQGAHVTKNGYVLAGWTTDKTKADAWSTDKDRTAATFTATGAPLYTTTYTVAATSPQTLYALWMPGDITYVIEHYRVSSDYVENGDGTRTLTDLKRIEADPVYTTTGTGKTESEILAGTVLPIPETAYGTYPLLKGYRYFPGFDQTWNGNHYVEIVTTTRLDGTTVFKLYYVSSRVQYTIEYYKVAGDGTATPVMDPNDPSKPLKDALSGLTGAYAKADGEYVDGVGLPWQSYTYVGANGETIVPTELSRFAWQRAGETAGFHYVPGTFTVNGVDYTSDPYKMIEGDGSTVLKFYFEPDTYTLELILNGTTYNDADWVKSFAGAGSAFVVDGTLQVTSGMQVYLPNTGAASRGGYTLNLHPGGFALHRAGS